MKVDLLDSNEINHLKWDQFVDQSPQGSIFVLSWYLDIIAPGWNGIIVTSDNNDYLAIMPIWINSKYGIKYALQPLLAKYWGILFKSTEQKVYDEYHDKKQIAEAIVSKIPKDIKLFSYNFSPSFDYPLPLYWENYNLNYKNTYQIDISTSYENIYNGFKREVKKQISTYDPENYKCIENGSLDHFIELLNRNSLHRKFNLKPDYIPKYINLAKIGLEKNAAKNITILDKNDTPAISVQFFYFRDTIYYYLGLVNPDLKVSSLSPWLISRELESQAQKYSKMDFCGSMVKNVETFIRGFGAKPIPYLNITKRKFPFNFFKI